MRRRAHALRYDMSCLRHWEISNLHLHSCRVGLKPYARGCRTCGATGKNKKRRDYSRLLLIKIPNFYLYKHKYGVSSVALQRNFTPFSTTNVSNFLYVFHSISPGINTSNFPDVTVMISIVDVPNSYSHFAMTPIVARPSALSNAMLFTLPSKYSFVLNMIILLIKVSYTFQENLSNMGLTLQPQQSFSCSTHCKLDAQLVSDTHSSLSHEGWLCILPT